MSKTENLINLNFITQGIMKFTKYNDGDVIDLGYIVHDPTYCFYLKNGIKKYIIEGIKQHKGRTDIVFTKNGEAYCTKKKPHHIFFDNTTGASYYYWADKNGVVDRKDGRPALIEYVNGEIRTKEWFQNGRRNGRDDKETPSVNCNGLCFTKGRNSNGKI